jgi:hypothetical protein
MAEKLTPVALPPEPTPVPTREPDYDYAGNLENNSRSFAHVVAVAMGVPDKEQEIYDAYRLSGNEGQWTAAQQQWKMLRNNQSRKDIVAGVITRAKALGFDPVDELTNDTQGLRTLAEQEEQVKGLSLEASPEVDAYLYAMQHEPRHITVGDTDAEAQRNWTVADRYLNHRKSGEKLREEALELSREMSQGVLEAGSGAETVAGLAHDIAPLAYTAAMQELGIRLSDEEARLWSLGAGSTRKKMKEHIIELGKTGGREAQWEFIKKVVTYAKENTLTGYSDWSHHSLIDDLTSEEVLVQMRADNTPVVDFIDDVASIMDYSIVGGITVPFLRWLKPGVRYDATTAITNATNKERFVDWGESVFASLDGDPRIAEWNVSKEGLAVTQLPSSARYNPNIEDIPDLLRPERERIQSLREQVAMLTGRTRSNVYENTDLTEAVVREARVLEQSYGGQVRPGMSRIAVHDDGNGVRFALTLGKNERYGFQSQRTAFEQVEVLKQQGFENIRVLDSNGGELSPLMTGDEALDMLAEIRAGTQVSARTGKGRSYYIQFDQDYFLRPTDKMLFGDDALVMTPEWMGGSVGRWVQSPSSQFARAIYDPYKLNVIDMPNETKRTIDNMYSYTEQFYKDNKALPTMDDYAQAFPDAGAQEYRGLYLTKTFYDQIYDINNERLYRDWVSRGYKSLRSNNGDYIYHGQPQSKSQLVTEFDGTGHVQVYNPETRLIEKLTAKEMDDLFEANGSVLKLDVPITVGDKNYSTLVKFDPKNTTNSVTELSTQPLQYIPGYKPRIYEDYHFIEKVEEGVSMNGRVRSKPHRSVIRVAGSQKEADRFVQRLMDDAKRDPNVTYEVKPDVRLSDADRTAADLQRMQVEGRLFFDNRQENPLLHVSGETAETISATNMLERTSRMVARQVSTEDLVKGYKNAFSNVFAPELQKIGISSLEKSKSSDIRDALKKLAREGTPEQRKRAGDALAIWDYIGLMEGNIDEGSRWFRRGAIQAAEYLAEVTSGVPGVRRATRYMARNAQGAAPIENLKTLAFFDYIVTRPIRQLVLQGGQHMFLQNLDPTYAGKWQLDSALLLQGANRKAAAAAGGKGVTAKNDQT